MKITNKSMSVEYQHMEDHFNELYLCLAETIPIDDEEGRKALEQINDLFDKMEKEFLTFEGKYIRTNEDIEHDEDVYGYSH